MSLISSLGISQEKVEHCIAASSLTECVSSLVLSGMCKIAGYEILRHGTSWRKYQSIVRNGANPQMGGETTEQSLYESSSGAPKEVTDREITNAKNHFYVFRDSQCGFSETKAREVSPFMAALAKRLCPFKHAFLSYAAEQSSEKKKQGLSLLDRILLIAKTIFTPKLKFVYSLEEIRGRSGNVLFENDPDYGGELAYRTKSFIPAHRIGLIGFFSHVNKKHVWEHIKSNPGRVVLGIIQLGAGILCTAVPGLGLIT